MIHNVIVGIGAQVKKTIASNICACEGGIRAIAQVIIQIARQVGQERKTQRFTSGPVLAGLTAGFMVMYVTGMLVG